MKKIGKKDLKTIISSVFSLLFISVLVLVRLIV